MRTRTFIGLIFLVAALLVAANPVLLGQASNGLHALGITSGLIPDRAKQIKAQQAARAKVDPVDSVLELKGYQVQENGDLLDMTSVGDRESNQAGRTSTGRRRIALPGEKLNSDAYVDPPSVNADGLLLDPTSCPVLQDAYAAQRVIDDASVKAQILTASAKADDPAACRAELQTKLDEVQNKLDLLPGERRGYAASVRGDRERMLIDMVQLGLYSSVFGDAGDDEIAASLRTAVEQSG